METKEIKIKLEESLKESVTFLGIVKEHEITGPDEYEQVTEFLKVTKHKMKLLDQERSVSVKPLNDQVREINQWFKKPLDKLKEIEVALKKMLTSYQVKQREEQEKLLAAAASASTEHVEAQALILAATKQAPPTVSGLSVREVWQWQVTDLSLIPHEFFSLDHSKLDAAVRNGAREIPGVRVYKDTRVSVRA